MLYITKLSPSNAYTEAFNIASYPPMKLLLRVTKHFRETTSILF